jgi:hypothetical protein
MEMLLIPKELAQGILNYLAERPWKEVYQAQSALMALQKAPVVEQDKPQNVDNVTELKEASQEQV